MESIIVLSQIDKTKMPWNWIILWWLIWILLHIIPNVCQHSSTVRHPPLAKHNGAINISAGLVADLSPFYWAAIAEKPPSTLSVRLRTSHRWHVFCIKSGRKWWRRSHTIPKSPSDRSAFAICLFDIFRQQNIQRYVNLVEKECAVLRRLLFGIRS